MIELRFIKLDRKNLYLLSYLADSLRSNLHRAKFDKF